MNPIEIDPVLFSSLLEQLKQLTVVLQEQQSFSSKWLPHLASVVALIIGLLSFISARDQIKTSRETTKAQIKSAEAIAKSQLENAKEITISQIKANLIATSRKEWIENLRKNVAELFALANKIHSTKTSIESEAFDKMWHLSSYIDLLLNSTEREHIDFITKQKAFVAFCAEGNPDINKWSDLKKDFLNAASLILKSEWNKVKSLT